VYRRFFYGEPQIVINLYHDVEGDERSKMRGRSWVHLLRLIFYRGYPFSNPGVPPFLQGVPQDYERKKSTVFWPFQRKNSLISTTTGFSAMESSMITFIIYAQPRRDAMHVLALRADRRSASVLLK
jgi:hypothetical protein